MSKKAVKIVSAAALAAGAAAFTGQYKRLFCRSYKPLVPSKKKTHEDAYYRWRDGLADYLRTRPHTEHSIINANGNMLRGFYYPAREDGKPSGMIAFIIHGYRSEHNETAGQYYDYYKSRGIDLFCVDHAAHGESEGEIISYGVNESRDCLKWIDYLTETFGSGIKICLHGFSMGGATVMLMCDRCPDNVRFIVEDSGYGSFETLLGGSLGALYSPLRLANRIAAGFDPGEIDVRGHVKCSRVPMLFVHGKLDPTVPFANAPELYELCKTEKACLYTENAAHVESFYRNSGEYCRMLDSFLQRYFTESK